MNDDTRQKVAQLLGDTSQALRQVTSERDDALHKAAAAETKLATIERRLEAEKVAARMHQKGLELDTDLNDLADHLEKAAQEGKLGEIQRAVEMVGPNMSIAKTAHVNDDQPAGGGNSDLVRYLVGSVG
jgi:DNA anti-recombination protein RmuC